MASRQPAPDSGSVRCDPPLLFAMVEGVASDRLRQLAAEQQWSLPTALPVHVGAGADVAAEVQRQQAAAPLRELGLAVEQRGLELRPSWRSDEAALQLLTRRPAGPAAVTMLQLRDPLVQAARFGPGSAAHLDAVARTGALLSQATRTLRDGDHPELWLLATGDPVPVQRTFDFSRALRRRLGWRRLGCAPTVRVLPELARIRPDNERTRQELADALQQAPFNRYGHVVDSPFAGELWFSPFDGHALGSEPWRGRRDPAATATALLPVPVRTETMLTVPGLVARLLMRAVQLLRAPEAAEVARARESLPDLQTIAERGQPQPLQPV